MDAQRDRRGLAVLCSGFDPKDNAARAIAGRVRHSDRSSGKRVERPVPNAQTSETEPSRHVRRGLCEQHRARGRLAP
jgi:hypothetical protein